MDNNMSTGNTNSSYDFDKIFSTTGRVLNTAKNVYDTIDNDIRNDSRRNMGGYPPNYGYPSQQSYGYGYYDDNNMNPSSYNNTAFGGYNHQSHPNMMSDFYPGISSPVYGKGGY